MLGKKTTSVEMPKPAPLKNGRKRKSESGVDSSRFMDEIRMQAYYNYLWRVKNDAPGSPETDWLEAERIVSSKMKAR